MAIVLNGSTGITSPGGDVSTSLTTGSVTTSGTNSVAALTVNSNNISAVNSLGFRNRIINGDMRIDQRNAGASVTSSANALYFLDRFRSIQTNSLNNKFSIQQNAGSIATPLGFTNYLGVTSLSAFSVGAADTGGFGQAIEGFNVADLGWGTANAQTVTVSFRVYSSLTGAFAGSIQNGAQTRSYPFTFTVSSANTWTTISFAVSGDTTGTWLTNSLQGLWLWFSLGSGSNWQESANTWTAGEKYGVSGQVNVVGTNGATFYITGVQLEAGTVATPFERRDYGRELMMCQRYFFAIRGNDQPDVGFMPATWDGNEAAYGVILFPVTLRVRPSSITVSSAGHFQVVREAITWETATAILLNIASSTSAVLQVSTAIRDTRGFSTRVATNSTSALLGFNAEL